MRRYLFMALIVSVLGGMLYRKDTNIKAGLINEEQAVPTVSQSVEIVLSRTYVCGVKEQEKKQETKKTLDQVLTSYVGWEIISVQPGKVELSKQENDISPECKQHGYFGLSPEGMLTLFHGLPEEKKVIQTYYQIDTARMKASLPQEELEQLSKGIKVSDLAEYNSILSTYGEFLHSEVEVFGH